MSRFNKKMPVRYGTPIVSAPSNLRTGNNAPGFERDPRSELFLLAVGNFVGQDMHYETGVARDERFMLLVRTVAAQDPDWTKRFIPWLRTEANMRTASIVAAVVASRVWRLNGIPGGRQVVNSILLRPDEPGEMLGFLFSTQQGRQIPKPIKRGIADAVQRLYNERNTLKYDTDSHAFRFGDVLELVHAKPALPYQVKLFKHLIDRRHGREGIPVSLPTISKNRFLREEAAKGRTDYLLDPHWLKVAGMTWEDVLSLAGSKVDKKDLWEALIPNMGYMALLRNLRNFDQAGVSDAVARTVMDKLADPEQVARSRQLPMRFLSAYRATENLRWAWPLEQALEWSLQNVPEFKGRTLILIDTSGSMGNSFSGYSDLNLWDAATIFGLAVAKRCEDANVVSFANSAKAFSFSKEASLLKGLERFRNGGYFLGGGTNTKGAVDACYSNHDRVIILTDEQANHHTSMHVAERVPHNKMVVTFNLAGYRVGHAPSGSDTRVTIGGLTDQAFKLLPILEKRAAGAWPF